MAMTDPVADMITRIRNGVRAKLSRVDVPCSALKEDRCTIYDTRPEMCRLAGCLKEAED